MKEYQVLISGILIAVAIYLGLTHTPPEPFVVPDPYEGAVPLDPSSHDTDFEVCMEIARDMKNKDGTELMTNGEAFIICATNQIPNTR